MPVEYAAIKSAIQHLNKYVVSYVNDSRFRINCVSPGGIFDHQPEAFLKAYKDKTHGAGMLDVEEVVGSVLFLLSEQSRYVTGQNIIVDDGFSLANSQTKCNKVTHRSGTDRITVLTLSETLLHEGKTFDSA